MRLLLIGLDGATFDVIKTHLNNLPTFKMLLENGVHSKLRSTIPDNTAVAWPAMCTGKNPAKFGIFDSFWRDPKNLEVNITDPRHRELDFFWDSLNAKIGLASVPMVPSRESLRDNINYYIPGSLARVSRSRKTKPEELEQVLGGYYYYSIETGKSPDHLLNNIRKSIEDRQNVFLHLLANYRTNLDFLYFNATDLVQHHFWGYSDLSHPGYKNSRYRRSLVDIYKVIDRCVGDLIDLIDDQAYVFIVSDHGGGSYSKIFNLIPWLEKESYLSLNKSKKSAGFLELIYQNFGKYVGRITPNFIKDKVVSSYAKNLVDKEDLKNLVDWENTIAYPLGTTENLYINLRGREAKGIVSAEKYDGIRKEISEKLKEIRDPITGEKIISNVFRREEIYEGPYLNNAPDLLLVPNNGYGISKNINASSIVMEKREAFPNSGKHRPNGIFIAYGPEVKEGLEINEMNIVDVAPTVLHLFGSKISEDIDGEVRKDIFKEESDSAQREVKYQKIDFEDKKIKSKVKGLKEAGRL